MLNEINALNIKCKLKYCIVQNNNKTKNIFKVCLTHLLSTSALKAKTPIPTEDTLYTTTHFIRLLLFLATEE